MKGWRKEPARHSLAARGMKTRPVRKAMPVKFTKLVDGRISIGGNNWSVECDPDGSHAILRMDDHIGWRWDGNENDWDIFIVRMSKSKIADEFIDEMKKAGLDYSVIKKMISDEDYELCDSVYALTGDNSFWHFGETGDREHEIVHDFSHDFGLIGKQTEEFEEYFWEHEKTHFTNFEAFKESEDYTKVEKDVRKIFRESKNLKEVMNELSSEDMMYSSIEAQDSWISSQVYPELDRISKLWSKEHPNEDIFRTKRSLRVH
jgi:hypothetical protein